MNDNNYAVAPATAKSPFSAQSLAACWGLTDCASPFHVQSNAGPETRNEKGSYGECWRLKKWHRKDVWMRKPKQDSLDGANAGVDVYSPVPDLNRQFKQTVNASLGASILKMIFLIFFVCLCWSKLKNDWILTNDKQETALESYNVSGVHFYL